MPRYVSQLTVEKLKRKYPWLYDDPVHRWRAEQNVELIHREPDLKELQRIWKNWQTMTPEQKAISEAKAKALYGKTNEEQYNSLLPVYAKQAAITLDIEKGDTLLGGRFKNHKTIVKDIGTDELGQPTINGMKLLSFRIAKKMPEKEAGMNQDYVKGFVEKWAQVGEPDFTGRVPTGDPDFTGMTAAQINEDTRWGLANGYELRPSKARMDAAAKTPDDPELQRALKLWQSGHGVLPRTEKSAEIKLDISKGDTLLGGRFKNHKTIVKEIGTDELGQPTINGMKLLSFRIAKKMPEKEAGMNQDYVKGFMNKCAELGVDPEKLMKLSQSVTNTPPVTNTPVVKPLTPKETSWTASRTPSKTAPWEFRPKNQPKGQWTTNDPGDTAANTYDTRVRSNAGNYITNWPSFH